MSPLDSVRPGGNLTNETASLGQVHFIMLTTPLKHIPPRHPAGAHVLVVWNKKQKGKCLVLTENLWEVYMLMLLHPDPVNDANLSFQK